MEIVSLPVRKLQPPVAGEVHVWVSRLHDLPVAGADTSEALSVQLRQRRMGQKFLLRLLLGAYLEVPGRDVEIVRSRQGKPGLGASQAASGITFNLSHAGDRLAIAIGTHISLGIDIEHRDRQLRWQALARRWFSPDEAEWLKGMEGDPARREFLRLWTRREALIKAMGETIAGHIGSIKLHPGDPPTIAALPYGWPSSDNWELREIDVDGLTGCVAAIGAIEEIRFFDLQVPGGGLPAAQ